MTPFRLATLVAALSLAFAGASSPALAADAAIAPSATGGAGAQFVVGLDKAGMDPTVRPQDDLFKAMNGHWVQTTEIPGDKPEYGSFIRLRDLSDERVKGIVGKLATTPQQPGTIDAKIADFYNAYLDTARIDAAGTAPLRPYEARLSAVKDKAALVALMADWQEFMGSPLNVQVQPDFKNPAVYAPLTWQGGLGLPDRDYYLKADARYAKARTAYVDYVSKLLALDGDKSAAAHARAVMALETRLAKAQWSQEALRDPVKIYNPMTVEELAARAPGLDWKAYLAGAQTAVPDKISVSQPDYAAAFAGLVRDEPLET